MTNEFRITAAFGTAAEVERLRDEAITMARVTGSVGATRSECRFDSNTNEIVETASVTVSRI